MSGALVLATRNAGKVVELRRILSEAGLRIDLVGMDAYPEVPDVVESGTTFQANALLKARAVAEATGLPAVADDSGLAVDVMGGAPGIFSARWSGRHGDDEANTALLLAQLSDVPDEHRSASFVCVAALARKDGEQRWVAGRMPGAVIRTPRGTGGFGYDPIFVPSGQDRTSAELSAAEKDAISHRGQAFQALVPLIRELLPALG